MKNILKCIQTQERPVIKDCAFKVYRCCGWPVSNSVRQRKYMFLTACFHSMSNLGNPDLQQSSSFSSRCSKGAENLTGKLYRSLNPSDLGNELDSGIGWTLSPLFGIIQGFIFLLSVRVSFYLTSVKYFGHTSLFEMTPVM